MLVGLVILALVALIVTAYLLARLNKCPHCGGIIRSVELSDLYRCEQCGRFC